MVKFGTGGFRAVIGEDFTKENVQATCQAVANIINNQNKKKEVCIGYDNRFMSETFAEWCAEVFAGNGIKVELFDRAISSPNVMYATKITGNDFGVMITASHNPYDYNGVKLFITEGRDAGVEQTLEIETEMRGLTGVKTKPLAEAVKDGSVVYVNYMEEYVDNIIKLLELDKYENNLKIVYDAKYGSTVEEIEMFNRKAGLKDSLIINNYRDAFFGFKQPAPTIDNVDELVNAVKENNADIGFSLDADGDRLAVIDENGKYIDNNYILAILYYFLVKFCNKKGGSVKNVATANMLDRVSEKLGYKCHEVPVGFKYVSAAIIEDNAVVGGESSGGLAVHGHIWGKDSLLAIALCIKAMLVMKKSFSEIFEEVKQFIGGYDRVILDKQYIYTPEKKQYIDKVLFENHQTPEHRYDVKDIVFTDYIKVYYRNDNWSLIRFSGTEPLLRVFAEAETKEATERLIEDWETLLDIKDCVYIDPWTLKNKKK